MYSLNNDRQTKDLDKVGDDTHENGDDRTDR